MLPLALSTPHRGIARPKLCTLESTFALKSQHDEIMSDRRRSISHYSGTTTSSTGTCLLPIAERLTGVDLPICLYMPVVQECDTRCGRRATSR
jgi:hypothetical protein